MAGERRRVAVLQSNYLPWKGYFDIIAAVDLFVFYDDVPYSKNTWRNRNLVKTPRGTEWLTVPVRAAAGTLICDVEVASSAWRRKHIATLDANYARAPHWQSYRPLVCSVLERDWTRLSELNRTLIEALTRALGIATPLADSRSFRAEGHKQDRLLSLLCDVGATHYLSGPAARDYIDETAFEQAGIVLEWMQYDGYPEYAQFHPPFVHGVTVLDLLAHTGPDAARHMLRTTPALHRNASWT
ncbi:MAG: hypothetical protein RL199_1765 [Pseudomonadota bacterium]